MKEKKAFDEGVFCAAPISRHDRIQLAHGSGGRLMANLIKSHFIKAFDNPVLNQLDDGALLPTQNGRLVFTTDSYVVDPVFFPGGNIGDLAVNGTVNDLAVCGARPLFLSVGFILEEGFFIKELETVLLSMRRAADIAGVKIVTGDTKVVDRGKADKIFINTAGLGIVEIQDIPSVESIRPGDQIILSGSLADHGIAVLSCREGLTFESQIQTDCAALNKMTASMLNIGGKGIHAMRDATRGGLAAVLNEFAETTGLRMEIYENRIPVKPDVEGACELLGLDPLFVANEGKIVAFVDSKVSERVLRKMQEYPEGQKATIIGQVSSEKQAVVTMTTTIGGQRIIDMPLGEQLPRIC